MRLPRPARIRDRRHTLGLVLDRAPGRLEEFWAVADDGETVGEVRWAAYSYALECEIAIAVLSRGVRAGDTVTVRAPEGTITGLAQELPFVQ